MSPRASIVISTYNRSQVLPYSIGSALSQTVEDLQILVVGDACTDDSEEVVRGIADPRVEWVNLPDRHGHQSGPNNEGIRRAEAPVVCYLGHDDLWFPHHVESILRELDGGLDASYGLVARVAGDGSVRIIPPLRTWRKGLPVPPSALAHRKELGIEIGGWRDYRQVECPPEFDLLNRMAEAGARIGTTRRISVVKFPASERQGIYFSGDVLEQREWAERIRTDAALEVRMMADMLEYQEREFGPKPLLLEINRFLGMIRRRVAKRFRSRKVPADRIDRNKRFKGSL